MAALHGPIQEGIPLRQDANADVPRFETVSRTKNARPTRTTLYVKMGNFRQIKYWLLHLSRFYAIRIFEKQSNRCDGTVATC